MKISTIFILNLPKYDPFGDVRDDVPEAPGNLDHLINFVARTLNYLSFKFHNDMTNTLATIYCHRSLPPKSNFWRFKTTVGGGKVHHYEIYQQDTVLSEKKVGLSTRVQGPYFPPRKTIVITRIRNTTSLIFKFGSKRR